MERRREKREKDVGDEEFFYGSQFCVYIGHRWRYRRGRDPKVLSTDHSQTF